MDKNQFRRFALKEFDSLSKKKLNATNLLITKHLINFFKLNSHLTGQIGAGYLPLKREFAPDFKILKERFSIELSYPVLENQEMKFGLPLNEIQGRIWLNDSFKLVNPDWILVPGVAFNLNGARLGRGKGYFDRYLSKHSVVKIGIAGSSQLEKNIPVEPHDCSMDFIITEKFCWSVAQQKYL